jgi:alkylated DNA nucleotide flippase Atl1
VAQLFSVAQSSAQALAPTTLTAVGLQERAHLQEWLLAHPTVLGDDVMVITSEYDKWVATDGAKAAKRLDILGLDRSGRLVVVELKRDDAPSDVHLQAITYAALVSRFTLQSLAEVLAAFRSKRGKPTDAAEARTLIEEHVGGDLDPDLLHSPRIVLVAGRFPREVTHTVVWLSNHVQITLLQMNAWTNGTEVLVGFQQVWPLAEVDAFTLAPAGASTAVVAQKATQRARAARVVERLLAADTLAPGAKLQLRPDHGLTASDRQVVEAWLAEDPARPEVRWTGDSSDPLEWPYGTLRGLPSQVVSAVAQRAGVQLGATRAPTWFVTPDDGRSLVDLADAADGTAPRDWSDLHDLLERLPRGRWTSYGDLAEVVGTAAQPLAGHISACHECPHPHRVLQAAGRVSPGFRWQDPERTDSPQELLEEEGVPFLAGVADGALRFKADDLRTLLS